MTHLDDLPEHEDDDRDDEVSEDEISESMDVQPEDPRYEGGDSPEPID